MNSSTDSGIAEVVSTEFNSAHPDEIDDLEDEQWFADLIGDSLRTVRDRWYRGFGPPRYKVGRRTLVRRSQVYAWLVGRPARREGGLIVAGEAPRSKTDAGSSA